MGIQTLKDALGDYAKDIKLNLSSVLSEEGAPELSLRQIWGVALASAYATKNHPVMQAVESEARAVLSEAEAGAAKAAATIMAMNNVYYRFVHLASDKEYGKLPAKLRMNVIANPGIPKLDFELGCLAVSAINGCGMCMDAHVNEVVKGGLSRLGVQSAIRIASVVHATAQAMVLGEAANILKHVA